MATKFKLNGKEVTAKEFDFNLMCEMEELGFDIDDFGNKPSVAFRGYIALCKNCSVKKAGQEINNHIINGGNLEELIKIMMNNLTNSNFFLALQTREEKKVTED